MNSQSDPDLQPLAFTEEHDIAVPYMQRLRDYYLALGYGNPYRWAQYADVPAVTPTAGHSTQMSHSRL